MPDRASEVLEEGLPVGVPKSFHALADMPYSTLTSILRAFQLLIPCEMYYRLQDWNIFTKRPS